MSKNSYNAEEANCRFFSEDGAVGCEKWGKTHDPKICDKCGWNPGVELSRKRKNRRKYGWDDSKQDGADNG